MTTSDSYHFTNFHKLSSEYRQWLTAMGAVNTTVLAFVLILTEKSSAAAGSGHYATLISSLFAGMFTCFIGSLLMGEAGSVSKNKDASHLFMIASVNIHIAAILSFSSMMLLAIVHKNLLGGNNIPIVIFFMFLFIGLASLLWMISMILNAWRRINIPQVARKTLSILLLASAVAVAIIYLLIGLFLNGKTAFPIPFTLCALSSVASVIIFVIVSEFVMEKDQPSGLALPVSIMLYAVGVSLPLASVAWLAWGVI
ncbi:MAG: hypothetical protein KJO08_09775 [Gammaproteobacteria bacterium]|nr:hypothetical protein [Gammaproteobacteria bacterium]NNJ84262.1 hypothetical protein [Gammaproteobacteria bacterium]